MSNPHRTAFAIGDAGGIAPELSARVLADRDANGDDLIVFVDLVGGDLPCRDLAKQTVCAHRIRSTAAPSSCNLVSIDS